MAEYSLFVIPIDSFTFINAPEWQSTPWANYHSSDGACWNGATPWTFTIDPQQAVRVDVSDEDTTIQDDSQYNWPDPQEQVFAPQQPEGSPFAGYAGAVIENEYEIQVQATVDGVSKTYTMVAVTTGNQSTNVIGFTFDGEWPPAGAELTYVQNSNRDQQELDSSNMLVPCFAKGTMIATPQGEVAIETLRIGDAVQTRDNGAQPIRWIGHRTLSEAILMATPRLRPIRIRAGALGDGVPARDLLVSPQHRILVRSRIAQKMFGAPEVLVAAKQLLQLDGVDIATDLRQVTYYHMLFDRHEVVTSDGACSESLFTGPEALKALSAGARREIFELFPELRQRDHRPAPSRLLPSGRMARRLVVRHIGNRKPLVS